MVIINNPRFNINFRFAIYFARRALLFDIIYFITYHLFIFERALFIYFFYYALYYLFAATEIVHIIVRILKQLHLNLITSDDIHLNSICCATRKNSRPPYSPRVKNINVESQIYSFSKYSSSIFFH